MLQISLKAPGQFATDDIPEPTGELTAGQVLVRVHRVGVCGTDLHAFAGNQPFFTYPRVLGHELGVEVVAVAPDVKRVQPGDACSVEPYLNCGRCVACRRGRPNCCATLQVLGVHTDGGMRPFMTLPAAKLHRSRSLSFDQLALVETLAIGAHAVERAEIRPDDTVLILGAGPIGLGAIQFARVTQARVVVADISPTRLAFCRERLGVADTLQVDAGLKEALISACGGELPTVVIDATGNARSMAGSFDLPAQSGTIVFVGLFQGDVTFNDPNFHRRELTLKASRNALPETFAQIISAMESGHIDTSPWITHRFGLAETPGAFPAAARDPKLLKAVISV